MKPKTAKRYKQMHHRNAAYALEEASKRSGYLESLLKSIAELEMEVSKHYGRISNKKAKAYTDLRQLECECSRESSSDGLPPPDQPMLMGPTS